MWILVAFLAVGLGLSTIKLVDALSANTMIADNETSGILQDPEQFWIGSQTVADGKATTPASYLRQGPAWMKSLESAMLGNLTMDVAWTCVDAAGVDCKTSATDPAAGTTGTVPITITFTSTIRDGNMHRAYWLDGVTFDDLPNTSVTTWGATFGVITSNTTTAQSTFTDGIATKVILITAEGGAATTQALVVGFWGPTLCGFKLSNPSSQTIYVGM